jgi:hypothetical protein
MSPSNRTRNLIMWKCGCIAGVDVIMWGCRGVAAVINSYCIRCWGQWWGSAARWRGATGVMGGWGRRGGSWRSRAGGSRRKGWWQRWYSSVRFKKDASCTLGLACDQLHFNSSVVCELWCQRDTSRPWLAHMTRAARATNYIPSSVTAPEGESYLTACSFPFSPWRPSVAGHRRSDLADGVSMFPGSRRWPWKGWNWLRKGERNSLARDFLINYLLPLFSLIWNSDVCYY